MEYDDLVLPEESSAVEEQGLISRLGDILRLVDPTPELIISAVQAKLAHLRSKLNESHEQVKSLGTANNLNQQLVTLNEAMEFQLKKAREELKKTTAAFTKMQQEYELMRQEKIASDALLDHTNQKLFEAKHDFDNKEMEIKVLLERKAILEEDGSASAMEELNSIKNQLFLLYAEKGNTVDRVLDDLIYLTLIDVEDLDDESSSKSIESETMSPSGLRATLIRRKTVSNFIPPPPPMSGMLSLAQSSSVSILLKGRIHSPSAIESFSAMIERTVKSVGLNTIRRLDLNGVHLSKAQLTTLADALLTNKTLFSLNISNTQLGNNNTRLIANALTAHSSVRSVNFSNNSIESGGFAAIAQMLKGNNVIESLDVSNNLLNDKSVRGFAAGLIDCNVSELICVNASISSVGIGMLTEKLMRLPNIRVVDFSANQIEDSACSAVANWIEQSETLESLNVSGNLIKEEGAKLLADAIVGSPSLLRFSMSRNTVGEEGALAFATVLAQNRILRALDLSNCGLSAEGYLQLVQALVHNFVIEELELWANPMSVSTVDALEHVLSYQENGAGEGRSLRKLNLRGVNLGENIPRLCKGIQTSKPLTSLDLTGNHLNSHNILPLAACLSRNLSIAHLFLGGNSIGDQGAISIGDCLISNVTINTLDLKLNSISNRGCKRLAEAIIANNTITDLNLSMNHIGTAGFEQLGLALKKNRSIYSLKLDGNNCGPDSIIALVAGLKANSTVTYLDLSSNRIRWNGCEAISKLLALESCRISTILLKNNSIKDQDVVTLCASLKNNYKLAVLILDENNINSPGALAISEVIQMNSMLSKISLLNNPIQLDGIQALEEALSRNTRVLCLHSF